MTFLSSLLRAQRGFATIEFAFASIFLFGIIMVALDIGVYAQQKLRLGNAVEQAAIIAFNGRAGTVDTASITTYVAAVAGGSPQLSYQCNGGTCGGAVATKCIGAQGADGWPTYTDPTTSNGVTSCADGSLPGSYMAIRATRTYQSVVVPDRYLNGGTMQQQAVVRLS